MRRRFPDILILLLLLLLPLLMFGQQTVGGKTLIPAENLYQYQPYAAYRDQVGAPAVPYNALVSDLVLQNYQFKAFIRQSLAQGEFPLWNPYQFSGIAFFAAGQQSTLYPFSLIYYALPLAAAYGWFMVSQLWLAGIFMYLLARGLGVGRAGGAVAGVTYQLSAFFVISAVFPMIVAAAVWLPLILLMIEFIVAKRPALRGKPAPMLWIAIGAGALGCCVLAGHVEITYYTLIVAAYYTAARLIYEGWKNRFPHPLPDPPPTSGEGAEQDNALSPLSEIGEGQADRRSRRNEVSHGVGLIARGLMVAAMLALGGGLGAIQLIPTVEAAQNNFRSDTASFRQVLDWADPPRDVIQFLMPNFYGSPAQHSYFDVFTGQTVSLTDTPTVNAEGNPLTNTYWGAERNYVESALYVGILPLALALYGLIRRRTVHQVIMALLGFVSLTFMFGLPTYALVYVLPGINQLHSPFRWVFPLTLCVALLAGFGMESLERERSKWTWRFGFALVGVGWLVLVGLLFSRVFYESLAPLVGRIFDALALATSAFSDARMFYSVEFVNVLIFGVVTLLSGVVFLIPSSRATSGRPPFSHASGEKGIKAPLPIYVGEGFGVRGIFAIALIAADLMIASYGFNPASDPALLDFTPPAIQWLQNQPGEWRYTTRRRPGQRAATDERQHDHALRAARRARLREHHPQAVRGVHAADRAAGAAANTTASRRSTPTTARISTRRRRSNRRCWTRWRCATSSHPQARTSARTATRSPTKTRRCASGRTPTPRRWHTSQAWAARRSRRRSPATADARSSSTCRFPMTPITRWSSASRMRRAGAPTCARRGRTRIRRRRSIWRCTRATCKASPCQAQATGRCGWSTARPASRSACSPASSAAC